MSFKAGERVELKSGGPTMTVSSVQDNGSLYCMWFNHQAGTWELKGNPFKPDTLKSLDR